MYLNKQTDIIYQNVKKYIKDTKGSWKPAIFFHDNTTSNESDFEGLICPSDW